MIDDASPPIGPVGTEPGTLLLDAEPLVNGHRLIDVEIVYVDRGVSVSWQFCVRCGARFQDRLAIEGHACADQPLGVTDPHGHELAADPDLEWVVCLRCERRGEAQHDVDQWSACRPLPETGGADDVEPSEEVT